MKTFAINKGGVSLIIQTRNNSSGENVAVDIEMSAPGLKKNSHFTMFVRIKDNEFNQLKSIFIQDEN